MLTQSHLFFRLQTLALNGKIDCFIRSIFRSLKCKFQCELWTHTHTNVWKQWLYLLRIVHIFSINFGEFFFCLFAWTSCEWVMCVCTCIPVYRALERYLFTLQYVFSFSFVKLLFFEQIYSNWEYMSARTKQTTKTSVSRCYGLSIVMNSEHTIVSCSNDFLMRKNREEEQAPRR